MTVPVPGSARARMLAAIQPAVPPPTIAMRLICKLFDIAPNLETRSHQPRLPTGRQPLARRSAPAIYHHTDGVGVVAQT